MNMHEYMKCLNRMTLLRSEIQYLVMISTLAPLKVNFRAII